jgi:enamine deaminase RidA (YjgF/YER057c/UK114 family)
MFARSHRNGCSSADLLKSLAKTMRAVAFTAALGLMVSVASSPSLAQKKKRAEPEITQTLELPKELPAVVVAESQRLVSQVSPLSARGLLSQQVRDGLRVLLQQAHGAQIVKLRGFVAGSGDIRRVPAIVSEVFVERRLALPALSVVRVGALPLEGAQVLLEAVAVEKKAVNPHGLAFISPQAGVSEQPLAPAAPLAEQSVSRLRVALRALHLEPGDVLRATCFLTSLDDFDAVRGRVAAAFPGAALSFAQGQRVLGRSSVQCEAVARLRQAPEEALRLLNPAELPKRPGVSQIAVVGPVRLALTGTQLAFGLTEADARLAFQRLGKTLEQAGAGFSEAAVWNIYPLSGYFAELSAKVGAEFCDAARPPAGAIVPVEGLASMDAAFALDAVAVVTK